MKLEALYRFVVEKGIEKDPRGKSSVTKLLAEKKKAYGKLTGKKKDRFDRDKLFNPYSDTRILNGSGETGIKSVIAGIDMEVQEVLLADRLMQKGKKIDMILTHHPEGRALVNLYEVMDMHADLLHEWGVPINVAEGVCSPRSQEVSRKLLPANHTRALDAAKLLGIPYMSCHTPADNHVDHFLRKLFASKKPSKLGDIIELLEEIPEYRHAAGVSRGPVIINGSRNSRAGRIVTEMTGGTEGALGTIERMARAGVGTVVGMHMTEGHLKKAKEHHLNVVIAGHISSDNIGMNLVLDSVEKKFGKLDVTCCSGFFRVKRK